MIHIMFRAIFMYVKQFLACLGPREWLDSGLVGDGGLD